MQSVVAVDCLARFAVVVVVVAVVVVIVVVAGDIG